MQLVQNLRHLRLRDIEFDQPSYLLADLCLGEGPRDAFLNPLYLFQVSEGQISFVFDLLGHDGDVAAIELDAIAFCL